jgi:hypothetical protein
MQRAQLSQRCVRRQQLLHVEERIFKRRQFKIEWQPVLTGELQIFVISVDLLQTRSKMTTRTKMIDFRVRLPTEFVSSRITRAITHHIIPTNTETIDMTEAVLLLYLIHTPQ